MYYVGIDIAKKSHVACIMREDNSLEVNPFSFASSIEGFSKLTAILSSLACAKDDVLIGMEATGMLFDNLYRHLKSIGYRVVLLNPYQTAKFREMDTMKRVKNDNIDAKMIAALIKSGRFSEGYVNEDELQSLRSLYRHFNSLQDQLKSIKRQTQSIITVTFPELEEVIGDLFSVSALALLQKYPTAKHYHKASVDRILKTFRNIKGNNFNEDKASKILKLAKESIYSGVGKDGYEITIRSNITLIYSLQKQIETIESAMLSLFEKKEQKATNEEQESMSELIDNLRTIPGVSDKTILALLAECGNLDRFHSAKALVGYLGLYPTLEQSGDSTKHKHLAKRGARLAKKAIYLASIAAVRHNDELRQVYINYRSKGRAKKEALIITARKLLQIIYAIYVHNTPYDPKRVFVAQPTK
ncbi:IS110 family transposase [Hydrogenimonas thermophila]|uniref:Transposase IS116/IS110/IS902 family protein n=5 Tax=Hydrogenimonas thermophila TaxID=223786 RepID=A0A1I5V1M2_9BACT|nr:IS110 family transposase [Hydrogenimonas thermophila]SFQ01390.1 Transposase IS116/IS110/IS902 family protein [Hydrogenimonas thermophila]